MASWCGQAAASDLSWSGPPECRESEQLSFQVERALGAPLANTGHLHLQVHIARVSPDARALLRIAGEESGAANADLKERLLVASNCATLVDTLAVAIALAVEAELPATGPLPAPTRAIPRLAVPASEPVAVSSAPVVADSAPAQEPAAERAALAPSVTALLVADLGSLPHGALGTAIGVELGGARWQLQLLGTVWFEQHTVLGASSLASAGADVNLATGALLGCTDPFGAGAQALSMSLCAGWEMGRLSGTGAGVNRPRSANALWLAPSLQAELAYRIAGSRLSLNARAGAALPLDRDEFVLDGLGTVHQPSSLAARAGLGVAVALE
jgi:hypothetical protein